MKVNDDLDLTVDYEVKEHGSDGELSDPSYKAGVTATVQVDWDEKLVDFFEDLFGGKKDE